MIKTISVNLTKTNWALLRKQKAALIRAVEDKDVNEEDQKDRELLDGLVNFLDHIQDSAAEVLGEQKIFGRLK